MARLVELTSLKEYLGVSRTECRYDLVLAKVLDRVTPVVEDHLGEPVLLKEREYFFEGTGCQEVILPFRKVNAVENIVKIGGVGTSDEELAPASYILVRYAGGYKLVHAMGWTYGAHYMTVLALGREYVPGPIQEAALRLSADLVAKSRIVGLGDGRLGVVRQGEVVDETEPAADGSYAVADVTTADITPEVAALLAPYCRIVYPF